MLELKALWKGDASTFGSAYNCAIGDTVTAGKRSADIHMWPDSQPHESAAFVLPGLESPVSTPSMLCC